MIKLLRGGWGGGGQVAVSGNNNTRYPPPRRPRQYGGKIDHRLAEADTLSGRFLIDDQIQPKGGENLSFPSFATSATQRTTSISLYHTHVFSPRVTNELRPGYTRSVIDAPLDATNPLAKTLPQI